MTDPSLPLSRLGRSLKDVAWRAAEHDVPGLAAEVAYFGLFSLFPFLIFLRSLLPYLPRRYDLSDRLAEVVADMVGADSPLYRNLEEYLLAQVEDENRALLSAGLLLSLWGASRGFSVVVKGLNRAYDVEDQRPWYERRLLALAVTLAVIMSLPLGVILVVGGGRSLTFLAGLVGLEGLPGFAIELARWLLVFLFLWFGVALVYRYAPATGRAWRWITPGSIFAVLAMIVLSLGLSWFVSQDLYQIRWLTYGALGTIAVTLVWMYLMAFCVLLGGELNGTLDRWRTGEAPPPGREAAPAGPR
jgi:membrane protein